MYNMCYRVRWKEQRSRLLDGYGETSSDHGTECFLESANIIPRAGDFSELVVEVCQVARLLGLVVFEWQWELRPSTLSQEWVRNENALSTRFGVILMARFGVIRGYTNGKIFQKQSFLDSEHSWRYSVFRTAQITWADTWSIYILFHGCSIISGYWLATGWGDRPRPLTNQRDTVLLIDIVWENLIP